MGDPDEPPPTNDKARPDEGIGRWMVNDDGERGEGEDTGANTPGGENDGGIREHERDFRDRGWLVKAANVRLEVGAVPHLETVNTPGGESNTLVANAILRVYSDRPTGIRNATGHTWAEVTVAGEGGRVDVRTQVSFYMKTEGNAGKAAPYMASVASAPGEADGSYSGRTDTVYESFALDAQQTEAALAVVNATRASPPAYSLLFNNCSDIALQVANAAGFAIEPVGLDRPATLADEALNQGYTRPEGYAESVWMQE